MRYVDTTLDLTLQVLSHVLVLHTRTELMPDESGRRSRTADRLVVVVISITQSVITLA